MCWGLHTPPKEGCVSLLGVAGSDVGRVNNFELRKFAQQIRAASPDDIETVTLNLQCFNIQGKS